MHASKALVMLALVACACSSSNSNSAVESECCVIAGDSGTGECVCGSAGGPANGDSITATVTGSSCKVVFTVYYEGGVTASETISGTIPPSAAVCDMELFGL